MLVLFMLPVTIALLLVVPPSPVVLLVTRIELVIVHIVVMPLRQPFLVHTVFLVVPIVVIPVPLVVISALVLSLLMPLVLILRVRRCYHPNGGY